MTVEILGWTLLHFLWQGAAAAGVLAVLNLLMRRARPQLRYAAAGATLLGMLWLPIATFAVLRASREANGASAWSPIPAIARPTMSVGEPTHAGGRAVPAFRARIEPALPALVGLWAAGVLLLSVRSIGGWTLAQRLRRFGSIAAPSCEQRRLTPLSPLPIGSAKRSSIASARTARLWPAICAIRRRVLGDFRFARTAGSTSSLINRARRSDIVSYSRPRSLFLPSLPPF